MRALATAAWLVWVAIFAVIASCAPPPCGGASQRCCEMGPSCGRGLACRGGGCEPSVCVQCGALGQTCCDTGIACTTPSSFCAGYECVHCGAIGESCCGTSCGPDAICSGGRCAACGDENEFCCNGSCGAGLQCQPTTTSGDGTCVRCGGEGQICCAGETCRDGLPCNANGACGLCGEPGLACCPGMQCTSPAECFSVTSTTHLCSHCGASGEPCCGGVTCVGALQCSFGTCQPCGVVGGPCCAGATCPTSGICSAGVCTEERDGGSASSNPCTPMACPAGEVCLAYPSFVCTRSCLTDGDCGTGRSCMDGLCLPSCTPGAMNCDRFGGACFTGIAPYTSLDAPVITGTPACIASCFDAAAMRPSGYPGCAAGTTCDPVSGQCTMGTPGEIRVGAPCTGASDCAGLCLAPLDASGIPTGFVGGYCVALARNPSSSVMPGASLPTSNCPSGAVAIPMPTSRAGDVIACYAACTSDCDCRVGYACDHDPRQLGAASPNGACLPIDCSLPGAACPAGAVCYRGGPFSHRLHPLCAPSSASGDGGLDAGSDAGATNTGCSPSDGGMDAAIDAAAD